MNDSNTTTKPGVRLADMPYWEAGMYLLHNCAMDTRTVNNVRDMIPSIRNSGMYDEAEVNQAVAVFQARTNQEIKQ